MKRGVAIGIMYVILVIFMLAGVVIMLPFILKQLSSIIAMLISQISAIGQKISFMGLPAYVNSLERLPGIIKEYIAIFSHCDNVNM